MRTHAQRKHVVHSLDTLLYQLHTLSYFASGGGLLVYILRVGTQITFSRTREIDGKRTLGRWFALVILFNIGALWSHAIYGASDGSAAVILDLVGNPYKPAKAYLLCLDLIIIILQCLLAFISYETTVSAALPAGSPDLLLPKPPSVPSLASADPDDEESKYHSSSRPPYIMDVRLGSILTRLRNPAPPPATGSGARQLPLPALTPIRAAMRMRQRRPRDGREQTEGERGGAGSTRLPGALETVDE